MIHREKLVKMIDHTQLKTQAGEDEIRQLCREARTFGFFAVCVHTAYIKLAFKELKGSGIVICSVAGFPLGANKSSVKAFEAEHAVKDGAREIDMVINVGALKDGRYDFVSGDIETVVKASEPALVKVILETCYLSEDEIVKACKIVVETGARFVKTSTGFGSAGAQPGYVRLMRQTVGPGFGVKASGGIKSYQDARRMIEAGADRLGMSASVSVISSLPRS